jgi:phage tail-like protein
MADFEFLTACRFHVCVKPSTSREPDGVDAIFLECKGFKATQQVVEACEVTQGGEVVRTKIPGIIKYNNLTLRRGMTKSMALWDWFDKVRDKKWKDTKLRLQQEDFYIQVFNQSGKETARFEFKHAWPTVYKIADFSAKSTDFEIEELEIAFEQFRRIK